MQSNRTLEYLGLAKNKLTAEDVLPVINCFGKEPFPADQVETHQQELKKRDVIIEKNKKLRASKKPEEFVPVLDALESQLSRDEEGNEVTNWFLLRVPQFKHLNLCMNNIGDDVLAEVESVLSRTPDDFTFTLSGNSLSKDKVTEIS